MRVRDLLPELALDVLSPEAVDEVERHLGSCVACRTEAERFREGAARVAFGLMQVQPDPGLEARVVEGLAAARVGGRDGGRSGTRRRGPTSRRTLRIAVAAALAAALLAGGSFTWALAMRGQVAVQRAALDQRTATIKKLQGFIADFQRRFDELRLVPDAEKSKVFGALLSSPTKDGASGQLLLVSIPGKTPDFVHMQVNLTPRDRGPYRVLFERPHAEPIKAGGLVKTPNGDYVLSKDPRFFDQDLSRVTGVIVLDRSGETLLTGALQLITSPTA